MQTLRAYGIIAVFLTVTRLLIPYQAMNLRLGRRAAKSFPHRYHRFMAKLFEDAGILERHDFRDGRSRYEEATEAHHDHLIDIQTGSVIEFRNEDIEKLQRRVAEELGFELVDHRLELYVVPKGAKKPR